MMKLFELSRTVMQVKAAQASVALEELEQMAESQGAEGVKNGKMRPHRIPHRE